MTRNFIGKKLRVNLKPPGVPLDQGMAFWRVSGAGALTGMPMAKGYKSCFGTYLSKIIFYLLRENEAIGLEVRH